RKSFWTIVDGYALPGAIRSLARFGSVGDIEFQIISYEQVEFAIAVIIDEGAAGAPALSISKHSRLLRHITETTIAIISVENVLAPIRNEQIFIAVVVVISNAYCRRPAAAS